MQCIKCNNFRRSYLTIFVLLKNGMVIGIFSVDDVLLRSVEGRSSLAIRTVGSVDSESHRGVYEYYSHTLIVWNVTVMKFNYIY